MNMKCKLCTTQDVYCKGVCMRCYQYLKKHPEGTYPVPPVGTVYYAPNGDPICHICGQAHAKLGQHIFYVHNIKAPEYKKMFGLRPAFKLTNQDYSHKMRDYTYQYKDKVIMDNLVKAGKHTRFVKGQDVPNRGNNYEIKQVHFGEPVLKLIDITYSVCNDPILMCDVVLSEKGGDVSLR